MPTPEARIEALYGFPFPDEFFRFREFLAELPRGLLADALDVGPAYPFAAAGGKKPKGYPRQPLWEDRCYHDLPEFVTLLNGGIDGLHWGYVFDAPGERPPIVAGYWHSDTFEHFVAGDDLFEAVRAGVEESEVDYLEMIDGDPDAEDEYQKRLVEVAKAREKLAEHWGGDREETGDDYLDRYDGSEREWVAGTWDRLGIVVPDVLYRPLG